MAMAPESRSATPDPSAAPTRNHGTRRTAWTVTLLVFVFMLLNFADKSVLGFAGVHIMRDLGISPEQFGVVQSAFFWLFAVGALVGGALSSRIDVRWLLVGMMAVWVLTMIPLLTPVGFGVLLVSRIVLGFAEGPAYALTTHAVHSWFPADKRAFPSGVLSSGASVGPLLAAPLLAWIIAMWNWHAAFAVLIGAGLLWIVVWLVLGRKSPEAAGAGSDAGEPAAGPASEPGGHPPGQVRLARILVTPTIIGVALLTFVGYWTTSLKVSWLPLYLEQGLGYDTATAGRLVTVPYAVAAAGAIGAGYLSNVLVARGMTTRTARGGLSAALIVLCGLSMYLFTAVDPGPLQMVLVTAAFSLNSAAFGVTLAIVGDLVAPGRRGVVLGCLVAFYSVAGVLAPLVLGFSIGGAASVTEGYGDGFAISGVVIVVGALLSIVLINPERDVAKLQQKVEVSA